MTSQINRIEGVNLLTVNETAAALRLQSSTIRAWILQRKIPFVRLGRRVFVRQADCEKLITDNLVTPVSQPKVEVSKGESR
jgi:excisionase family DNA binding protein